MCRDCLPSYKRRRARHAWKNDRVPDLGPALPQGPPLGKGRWKLIRLSFWLQVTFEAMGISSAFKGTSI